MKKIHYILVVLFCFITQQSIAADMPQPGTLAPAFTSPSQDGKDVSLSDFNGKWVVLYFYPKDFSSGCSLEAHNFQADIEKYRARNAVIIGISGDSLETHRAFCTKQGLDFKLLSDTDHAVSTAYGSVMKNGEEILSARTTFLIDPTGIIRKTYATVDPMSHDQEVLSDLDRLQSDRKQ